MTEAGSRLRNVTRPRLDAIPSTVRTSCGAYDFSPCTCFSFGNETTTYAYVVECDGVDTEIVQSIFVNLSDITYINFFFMKLPASNNIPANLLASVGTNYIDVTCATLTPPLTVDRNAFDSSEQFAVHVTFQGCDMSQSSVYDFAEGLKYLNSLAFMRCAHFEDLTRIPDPLRQNLYLLSFYESEDLRSLSDIQLPSQCCQDGIVGLTIENCPNFRDWDNISTQWRRLKNIDLKYNQMDDQTIDKILSFFVSTEPLSGQLTIISLEGNLLTKVPKQIQLLTALDHLSLEGNKIVEIKANSLTFKSPTFHYLTLKNNSLTAVESGAFQGTPVHISFFIIRV